jgi:serine/threonine-protein kinase
MAAFKTSAEASRFSAVSGLRPAVRPEGSASEDAWKACAPGTVIGGRYLVERVLGEGAMGVVVAVRHVMLDELFALKFIRPDLRGNADVKARFAREAKAASLVKNEHVAAVVDVGIAETVGPYLVMEYLEGEDLERLLGRRGALGPRHAVDLALQGCEGLAAAHAAGVLHRDVKPANLFLVRRGNLPILKALDFGISKVALTGTMFGDELAAMRTTLAMGTPCYMSPEQLRGAAEIDARTDIWSLGSVLYELLSNRVAFAGPSVPAVCALVIESDPPPLLEVACYADGGLARVVFRCLEKQRSRRFADIAELARALVPYGTSNGAVHAQRAAMILGKRPSRPSASSLPPPRPRAPRRPSVNPAFRAGDPDDDGASILPPMPE